MNETPNFKAYQLIGGNGYLTVRLVGNLDGSNIGGFDAEVELMLNDPYPHAIINCEQLTGISKDWLRSLLKVQTFLKQFNKEVRLIMVHPQLKAVLKREGVDTAFKYSTGLRQALSDLGLVTKKMLDTDFINPFLTATLHVLNIQASVEAKAGKIYLKKPEESLVGDVSGVIGIVCQSFERTRLYRR